MAKQGKNKKTNAKDEAKNEKVIAHNRRARHDYLVLDTMEC